MKTLNYVMFLFISLFVMACGENANEASPETNVTNNSPQFQEEGDDQQIELGFFEGEEFHFTVSEDERQAVYNYNLELNIEGSGELHEAEIIETDNPESTYFLVMSGSLNGEGSASLSANVNLYEGENGLRFIRINPRPVYPGFCYSVNCSWCRQSDLNDPANNGHCKCLASGSGSGPGCPLITDPTFVWTY